jgi:hypothetical protein
MPIATSASNSAGNFPMPTQIICQAMPYYFSSVAYVWADHKEVWFFLSLFLSPVRMFKFRHMFCRFQIQNFFKVL